MPLNRSFSYRGFEIEHVVNARMKNIYLRIGDDGKVVVKSSRISEKRLLALIDEKEAWISKAISSIAVKPRARLGEEILYFGEVYPLDYHPSFEKLRSRCESAPMETLQRHYQQFYKSEAQNYLRERLEYFAVRMELRPKEMKLRQMRRQWGNCRSNGVITFNINLIQVPKECIDYVVVHELAHMVHMNHSKAFHDLVEEHLPQSREKRGLLKRFNASL
jgi:predicted metal-dependent hydrolase